MSDESNEEKKKKSKRPYLNSKEIPKAELRTRACSRCGRPYTGMGRLLCSDCFRWAAQTSPFAEGFDA